MDRSSDHVDTVDVWGQTQHVLREGHSLSLCGPGQGRVCHVGVSSGCAQYVWQGVWQVGVTCKVFKCVCQVCVCLLHMESAVSHFMPFIAAMWATRRNTAWEKLF